MLTEISVVIPAYNEELRLPSFLASVILYLHKRYPNRHEVIVVDDGSSDRTSEVAIHLLSKEAVITFPKNKGKGAAVRAGMLAAKGKYVLFADADGATPIFEEERLKNEILAGASIAIGSRAAKGGKKKIHISYYAPDEDERKNEIIWHILPNRYVSGRVFSFLVRSVLHLKFADTQCGFKMFTFAAAQEVFKDSILDRFAFDIEILRIAQIKKLTTKEVPVNWHDVHGSKVKLVRDSIEMFRAILEVKKIHPLL